MSDVPEGWSIATVEELAGPTGLATDGDWIESKDQDPSGDVRLVQLADIGDGEFRDRSARFLTSETAHRLNCSYLQPGDLLIARMPDPLGRACIFPGVDRNAITAVDVFIWRTASDGVEPRWLMHFINSPDRRAAIADEAGGTTRQRIAGGRIKQLPIPVPPLPEQRRIVAKIDSLSAKSKRARDRLDHAPRLVEKYKQAVLQSAFTGTLAEGGDGTSIERSLGEIIEEGPTNGWSPQSGEDAQGALTLKLTATTSGVLRLDHKAVKRVYETPPASSPNWLEPGDILIQRANALEHLGATAIYDGPRMTYIYPDLMMRIRVSHEVDRRYLWRFLNSDRARSFFRANATGTAGNMPKISGSTLKRLRVPYPAPNIRAEVVRRVDSAFAWIDRLAAEATSARKLINRLDQAILSKAFRGELVPQDPKDEPASVLLERITAERAGAGGGRRRRGRASDHSTSSASSSQAVQSPRR